MHWAYGGYGMGFGWIFMIIFWGLVILGVVYLVKSLAGGNSAEGDRKESAEEVLKKRFARGEIKKEELAEALAVLNK